MKNIRWVRRRKGWSGFVGNTKVARVIYAGAHLARNRLGRPRAEMLRGPYVDRYGDVEWLQPTSTRAALEWCERHYAPIAGIDMRSAPAYLVLADGTIKEVIGYAPTYSFDRITPLRGPFRQPDQVPYTRVECPGRLFAKDFMDPYHGAYGEARALIYVEPGGDTAKMNELAEVVVRKRAFHMGLLP